MYKLVLVRHGESIWNLENVFTGWTDVDLSERGVKEAEESARLLKEEGYTFDVAYTSVLKRAIRTLWIILDEMDLCGFPSTAPGVSMSVTTDRCRGSTRPRRPSSAARSWSIYGAGATTCRPPPAEDDPRNPARYPRYADLSDGEAPLTECLKDTVARMLPYWHETIAPAVRAGKRVLCVAHGNSLRALVKYLDNVSDQEIPKLNIPTGIPLVYELDDGLSPIRHYYLGDPEAASKAAAAVAAQLESK